jgi:hypothetical protein
MVNSDNKPLRLKEIIIAAMALGLSILAIILSQNINLLMGDSGLDARWWPTVLSTAAAILSGLLLFCSIFLPVEEAEDFEPAQKEGWLRIFVVLTVSALYVFAWSRFGYIIPTAVYLFVLLWTFSVRSKMVLVLYPVLTTAFIYILFHTMLRVPL